MRASPKEPNEWQELTTAAQAVASNAYAPYSHLRVGAALEAESGRIYTGCNVENSSFGLTVCAERSAVFQAVARGEKSFARLAIFTPDAGPLSPCGACRQVLAEMGQDLRIISVGRGGLTREFRLSELLPQAFGWPAGEARAAPSEGEDESPPA
jgi:cytidine deaminase